MPDGAKATPDAVTTLSTKGQVVLPKAIRDDLGWRPGTRIEAVRTPEGVLLRAKPLFKPATINEVFGSLKYDGPPATVEQMDEAVAEMFRREWGREHEGR